MRDIILHTVPYGKGDGKLVIEVVFGDGDHYFRLMRRVRGSADGWVLSPPHSTFGEALIWTRKKWTTTHWGLPEAIKKVTAALPKARS